MTLLLSLSTLTTAALAGYALALTLAGIIAVDDGLWLTLGALTVAVIFHHLALHMAREDMADACAGAVFSSVKGDAR